MPQSEEEKTAQRLVYYTRWKAKHPDYYRNRRRALGETLLEKERVRNKRRRPAKGTSRPKLTDKERQDARRSERQARRARQRGAFVERVSPTKVFERDIYICQRCYKQCPSRAKVPDRDAPTVDHIIALVNGGKHCYENVQCLCFICNSKKGSR